MAKLQFTFPFLEDSPSAVITEDQAENVVKEDNSHLKDLHSYVTDCEENLSKHK